jgi:hypothetical protein
LALALTTRTNDSAHLDPVSRIVLGGNAPAVVALEDFSVGNIVGCTNVVPEIATSNKTGDGQNERWIVNSHLHLATRNDVYKL